MIEDQEKIYKIKENQKKWPNFQRYKVTKKKSSKSKEIRLKSGQFNFSKIQSSKYQSILIR